MPTVNRRRFLAAAATAAAVSGAKGMGGAPAHAATSALPPMRVYSGPNLHGWATERGDACWPPAQVLETDIARVDHADYSELQANVAGRAEIMAHTMCTLKVTDPLCLAAVHTLEYEFRLPYLPAVTNTDRNGQTVEGSITVWDGKITRRQSIVGWQWLINPHDLATFGVLQCWTPSRTWQPVGKVAVDDTDWHSLRLVLDLTREATSLQFDGVHFPACYANTAGDAGWGDDVSAWVGAEAISIYPGTQNPGGKRHEAHFRNWRWTWEPATAAATILPMAKG